MFITIRKLYLWKRKTQKLINYELINEDNVDEWINRNEQLEVTDTLIMEAVNVELKEMKKTVTMN